MNDMAIIYVDVVGEILAGDGTPAVGDVIFQIPQTLRDVVDNVVYTAGSTFTATLAVDGTFTVQNLPATDSPDVTPTGWMYRVHVHTDLMSESFSTSLPAAFAPIAEFADLIPAQSEPCTPDGTPCATLAQIADLQEQINEIITSGNVISVNGLTGVVVLNAASVGADPAGAAAAALTAANTYTDSQILVLDGLVVHKAGAETITGIKTFSANPVFNAAGIPQAAVANLVADLAARVVGPASSTDDALARFDLATGKLIQDSTTTLADTGEMINRGDLIVRKIAATGEYGLRVSGGGLDFDAAGFDLFISVWSGTGVGIGTQRTYIRAEAGAQLLHALGRWIWSTTPFGAAVHALDPVTGVAELGGKNGLLPWQICGRGVVPGSPAAGTWNAGDIMMDSVGEIWLCTASGTPGTWVTGP